MVMNVFPTQVYAFLSFIQRHEGAGSIPAGRRILDCGAGGPRPPLALFAEHGFDVVGVEVDPERAEMAREAGRERGLSLDIREGDMRALPFDDDTFDYVYEFYSLCHLTRADMPVAIREMMRVLKPGGVCYLGFMGKDSWPLFGRDTGRGEVVFDEGGREVLHSVYEAGEPDDYFKAWTILQQNLIVQRALAGWAEMSLDEWMSQVPESERSHAEQAWRDAYESRLERVNYTHEFYFVQKSTR